MALEGVLERLIGLETYHLTDTTFVVRNKDGEGGWQGEISGAFLGILAAHGVRDESDLEMVCEKAQSTEQMRVKVAKMHHGKSLHVTSGSCRQGQNDVAIARPDDTV